MPDNSANQQLSPEMALRWIFQSSMLYNYRLLTRVTELDGETFKTFDNYAMSLAEGFRESADPVAWFKEMERFIIAYCDARNQRSKISDAQRDLSPVNSSFSVECSLA